LNHPVLALSVKNEIKNMIMDGINPISILAKYRPPIQNNIIRNGIIKPAMIKGNIPPKNDC